METFSTLLALCEENPPVPFHKAPPHYEAENKGKIEMYR